MPTNNQNEQEREAVLKQAARECIINWADNYAMGNEEYIHGKLPSLTALVNGLWSDAQLAKFPQSPVAGEPAGNAVGELIKELADRLETYCDDCHLEDTIADREVIAKARGKSFVHPIAERLLNTPAPGKGEHKNFDQYWDSLPSDGALDNSDVPSITEKEMISWGKEVARDAFNYAAQQPPSQPISEDEAVEIMRPWINDHYVVDDADILQAYRALLAANFTGSEGK